MTWIDATRLQARSVVEKKDVQSRATNEGERVLSEEIRKSEKRSSDDWSNPPEIKKLQNIIEIRPKQREAIVIYSVDHPPRELSRFAKVVRITSVVLVTWTGILASFLFCKRAISYQVNQYA